MTKLSKPNVLPLSVIKMFSFPASWTLLIIFPTLYGDKNCPFLTFITFPVLAADVNKSVCLHKNAGI